MYKNVLWVLKFFLEVLIYFINKYSSNIAWKFNIGNLFKSNDVYVVNEDGVSNRKTKRAERTDDNCVLLSSRPLDDELRPQKLSGEVVVSIEFNYFIIPFKTNTVEIIRGDSRLFV